MSKIKLTRPSSRMLQKLIRFAGVLVTVIALLFAIQRTMSIGQTNWDKLLNMRGLLAIVIGGAAYGLNGFFLVRAWQKLLNWFGQLANFKLCVAVYGRTQLAKYIPGNIFHLPGRHVVGVQVGFNHPAQIGAAIYEIVGLIASAGLITLLGIASETPLENSSEWLIATVLFFIVIFSATHFLMSYFKVGQKLGFPDRSISDSAKHFLPVWTLYLIFFVLAGVIFWGIVGITTGTWLEIPIQTVLSIFAVSWLIGFLTPGAPAGIGVREATIILILTGFIGEPAAVIVAIVSRLVVTIGDLIFFAVSSFFPLTSSVTS